MHCEDSAHRAPGKSAYCARAKRTLSSAQQLCKAALSNLQDVVGHCREQQCASHKEAHGFVQVTALLLLRPFLHVRFACRLSVLIPKEERAYWVQKSGCFCARAACLCIGFSKINWVMVRPNGKRDKIYTGLDDEDSPPIGEARDTSLVALWCFAPARCGWLAALVSLQHGSRC